MRSLVPFWLISELNRSARKGRKDVYIGHLWPTREEIAALMKAGDGPRDLPPSVLELGETNPLWKKISAPAGQVYSWPKSTYIAEPPFLPRFLDGARTSRNIMGARILGIFGDSVTTDHISPAGSIKPTSPAGIYLQEHDVASPTSTAMARGAATTR